MAKTGQRRHPRYEVHDVQGSLLFRTRVEVRNISVSGLALETGERLQLGRSYRIKLTGDGEDVEVSGTIRWCRLAQARSGGGGRPGAVYEAGLAFDDVFTERAHSLLKFLEQHVVLAPQQRLTGRFQAKALGPADLETLYSFEVLTLSLSGMLVRTQLEAALDSAFGLELGLKDGPVSVSGRVAFVHRGVAAKGETVTELGLEFVDVTEESRRAIQGFIAQELERNGPEPVPPAG